MAPPTKRARGAKAKKSPRIKLAAHHRKREVLGLILMVLAFLLSLAIVTYNHVDDPVARTFSLTDLFAFEGRQVHNYVGLLGAVIARVAVRHFLGYCSLLLTLLLFLWGYVVFRNRTPAMLPLLTSLLVVSAFLLAAFTGWFSLTLDQDFTLWSGMWGMGIAGWMQRIVGAAGSFLILIVLLLITMMLVIDHDIQRTLDRFAEVIPGLRDRMHEWSSERKKQRLERRAERMRLIQEREVERERRREERASLREKKHKAPETMSQTGSQTFSPSREGANPIERETKYPASMPARSNPLPPRADAFPEKIVFDNAPENDFSSSKPAAGRFGVHDAPALELKVRERIEEERADYLQREADVPSDDLPFEFPVIDLLDEADSSTPRIDYDELEENKQVLLDKLATYNIQITDINAVVGPTVTLYELAPAPGIKISRITALEDDLAMAMAARGIRMIAPIPGKSAIGVEIPNRHRELVQIRDVIGTARFRDAKMELPVAIGKSIEGEVFLEDLTKMPHLLIAGATGSGKSVGLNTLIAGLLYACHPSNLKFVMIDPKKIELQQYARISDHYIAMPPIADDPIITDFNQALGVLKSCEKEMERRYDLLSRATVRGIKDYNKKVQAGRLPEHEGHRHLPYIVVVVDELADLMMTAGKDIEAPIARLAQMARAVGIHLVLATQRPSVDVITGLIKANFPSRIAYQVASKVDSRTILDQNGAEGLVGNGDLLYMNGSRIIRLQGPFVSVDEVDRITDFIAEQPGEGPYILPSIEEALEETSRAAEVLDDIDDLFNEAARIIVRSQQGSVSLLQRKLSIGYTRAARIVDQLEDAGIVGPFEGSKARQVLLGSEEELESFLSDRP